MKTGKSWAAKLTDSKGLPKITKVTGKMASRWGNVTMVIPAPIEVDEIMRKVPRGRLITISEIRTILAKRYGVVLACPITTGIFAWIAAHAAEEAATQGKRPITPFWRTLKAGGELNAKYPGGIEGLKKRLEREGHKVLRKAKRHFVVDFDQSLCRLHRMDRPSREK